MPALRPVFKVVRRLGTKLPGSRPMSRIVRRLTTTPPEYFPRSSLLISPARNAARYDAAAGARIARRLRQAEGVTARTPLARGVHAERAARKMLAARHAGQVLDDDDLAQGLAAIIGEQLHIPGVSSALGGVTARRPLFGDAASNLLAYGKRRQLAALRRMGLSASTPRLAQLERQIANMQRHTGYDNRRLARILMRRAPFWGPMAAAIAKVQFDKLRGVMGNTPDRTITPVIQP